MITFYISIGYIFKTYFPKLYVNTKNKQYKIFLEFEIITTLIEIYMCRVSILCILSLVSWLLCLTNSSILQCLVLTKKLWPQEYSFIKSNVRNRYKQQIEVESVVVGIEQSRASSRTEPRRKIIKEVYGWCICI